MEIYREQPTAVTLPVPPGTTTVTAEVYRDGVQQSLQAYNSPGGGVFLEEVSVNIPYKAVRFDGLVVVVLKPFVDSEIVPSNHFFPVVTPILGLDKIAELVGNAAVPADVEFFVRHIIESHTGQSFGYKVGKEVVQGNGEDRLSLNRRLLRVTSFEANGIPRPPTGYAVAGDGWYLYNYGPNWLEIKEAPPDELLDYHISGPIRLPAWYKEKFSDNVNYIIDGEWGYYYVPADVQAAAALLVNDYACSQSAYRDRYLNIIKSSDWTLEYNERAWEATGNARADQILSKYKRGEIGLV